MTSLDTPRLAALKAASTLSDVAALLNFHASSLSYILYIQPDAEKYQSFTIPKRAGGQRHISAPCDSLKLLQRNLATFMQDCLAELAAKHVRSDRAAHGFVRKKSIITNARQHRNRKWVFNLDLKDFFPSINFGRLRGYLIRNRDFELNSRVATVIAQIACHNGTLPQGSPCSPVFANLIAHVLDIRLVKLAREVGCTYSRYADDLTFSTNKLNFPEEIAIRDSGENSHLWVPGNIVRDIIERSDFRINDRKTHQMYRSSRQEVTGLVVNKQIGVKKDYRHNVRAMVDRLVKTGAFEVWGAVEFGEGISLQKAAGTT